MASSLGKRRTRDHGATLFVSNLPYSTTSADLQTVFSDVAPVRSAFVVLDPQTQVSKGVGYVLFASTADADTAHDVLTAPAGAIVVGGRTLRVEWASPKARVPRPAPGTADTPASSGQPRKPLPRRPAVAGVVDPQAVRTVSVTGLPAQIDARPLWKRLRKLAGVERMDWPVSTPAGQDPTAALVLFATSQQAQDAVSKLHAHVFKGSLLSATLKKRFERLVHHDSAKPSPASRLIVRNLPFDFSEQDLRAVFLPYGSIFAINMPMATVSASNDRGDDEGGGSDSDGEAGDTRCPAPQASRSKGFAFVWMLSRSDAEAALRACNGMRVGAGFARTLVGDKQRRKKAKRETEQARGGEDPRERTIEVDWALSKDRWEEAQAKLKEVEEADKVADESEHDDMESQSLADSEEESQSGEDSEETESEHHEAKEGGQVGKLPQTDTATTVFVRNVPFAATEEELQALFRAWGPLRYARLTVDAETGRPRGTGFVCFRNKADADKVIDKSETLRAETTTGANRVRAAMPSLLTPDPSSGIAHDLVLHGRTLDVVRAIPRDEAERLREEGVRERQKTDKRSLYLLREGAIFAHSPGASALTPAEIEERTKSFNARRTTLRTNPSLYVSRTRLSVRRLPLFVTERVLKRLAMHAMRAFDAEVRAGTREGLSADEVAAPGTGVLGAERPRAGRGPRVRQVKIVRQTERVDPGTGRGRSRGYGFVETHRHADALRVLRWANNHPDVWRLLETWHREEVDERARREPGKTQARAAAAADGNTGQRRRLVVEFAIENVQIVRRRAQRQTGVRPLRH